MNRQHKKIIHPAFYYSQVLAISNMSAIPEDEKITLRLSSVRSTGNRLTEREDKIGSLSDSPVYEINLDSLSAADQILIETAHSVYSFTVTDPAIPSGKLLGGVLGNRLVSASLVPSQSGSSRSRSPHRSLRAGSKFIFLIEHGNKLRRLTTSSVKRLLHRKTRGLPAGMREVTLEHLSSDKSDN